MVKDLTVGKPSNVLWRFCLPMFGSIVFQQLYNIADSLVAGQFIGENASSIVWTDPENDYLVNVDGFFSQEELMELAMNLIKKEVPVPEG